MYGWTKWNYEQYMWDGLAREVGGPEKETMACGVEEDGRRSNGETPTTSA
jgi:hypothetical protein